MAARFQIVSSAVCTPPLPTKARVTSKRMSTSRKTNGLSVDQELKMQSAYLCYHLFYYILKEEGIKMNGYASSDEHDPPPNDMPCLTGAEFQDTYETIKRNCMYMISQHRDEMITLVKNLDIRDSTLQSSFMKVASTIIAEEVRWGRIMALFVFTAMLGVRLHAEGQQHKIEGLPQWLAMFINDNVSEWLQRTPGGWTAVNKALEKRPTHPVRTGKEANRTGKEANGSWLTVAALGLGAIVVGALVGR